MQFQLPAGRFPRMRSLSGKISQRLLSLDLMRGFIMVLLALESTGLYEHLFDATKGNALNNFFLQFFHHPVERPSVLGPDPTRFYVHGRCVNGLFANTNNGQNGISWDQSPSRKIFKALLSGYSSGACLITQCETNGLSFELWDVLTQLSFTTLVASLIFRWSATGADH